MENKFYLIVVFLILITSCTKNYNNHIIKIHKKIYKPEQIQCLYNCEESIINVPHWQLPPEIKLELYNDFLEGSAFFLLHNDFY
tara:strand:+ start:317 stop:568 length:252 start_codon:yes stop_codon:yes gene_type:complete